MNWKRMLAYVTGSVDQELLLRNEYLVSQNGHTPPRQRLALVTNYRSLSSGP
jgi:hypothetical protein